MNDTHSNPNAIVRVNIEKLFNQYSYSLPPKEGEGKVRDLSKLFMLYGDNGSGKTTILRILFGLLSPEDAKGHKTEVSLVPFRRFAVELADGTTIEALRTGRSAVGTYRAAIMRDSVTIAAAEMPTGKGGRVDEEERIAFKAFLAELERMKISLNFLSDNRRMQTKDTDLTALRRKQYITVSSHYEALHAGLIPFEDPDDAVLRPAIARATDWISQQALRGSSRGQTNVHGVYTDIAKYIAESPLKADVEEAQQQAYELEKQLNDLSAKSAAYFRFGLASELPVDEIVATLHSSDAQKLPLLCGVLKPYARSIEARLRAFEHIHAVLNKFIDNINQFFGGSKRVDFNLREGLTIRTRHNHPLEFEKLSSGEKQLLLLMCSTLSARDHASILLIDEPEISLNIKWQRGLIQALLDCVSGSGVQMMLASHSIELIARHRSQVVKLVDRSESEKKSPRRGESDDPEREPNDRGVTSQV